MNSSQVEFSHALNDPSWDAFVKSTPGGHHLQSSLWGQVKAAQGWRVARTTLSERGKIVAGCQLLLRDLRRFGSLAYAPRGPLVAGRDPVRTEEALDAVRELVARERVRYLKLQPPVDRSDFDPVLRARGYVPSTLEPAPVATVRVDVTRPLDQVLEGMRSRTRSYIRSAERKGATVRAASAEDLRTFTELIAETGERKGFNIYSHEYYEGIWRLFEPTHARVLLAEHEGRALAGTLLIAFGDTVLYKMGGSSSDRAKIHPNELVHWAGIKWAHDHGYRYYDLEGIRPAVARQVLAGENPPEAREGVMHFKLGFGGEIVLFPGAYDFAPSRLVAPLVRLVAPRLDQLDPLAHRLLGRVR